MPTQVEEDEVAETAKTGKNEQTAVKENESPTVPVAPNVHVSWSGLKRAWNDLKRADDREIAHLEAPRRAAPE
jgi:hypothetical protein